MKSHSIQGFSHLKVLDLGQELLRVLGKEIKSAEARRGRVHVLDVLAQHRRRGLAPDPPGVILEGRKDLAADC